MGMIIIIWLYQVNFKSILYDEDFFVDIIY